MNPNLRGFARLSEKRISWFLRCGPWLNSTRYFTAAFVKALLLPPMHRELASRFSAHVEDGLWKVIPVTEALLRRTNALMVSAPGDLFIRTADAVHLMTACEIGERGVWTNDATCWRRHLTLD